MPQDVSLILCYDGSEDARHAVKCGGDLLTPRRALVLTVWEPTPTLGPGLGATEDSLNFVELDRAGAEQAGRLAEEGVRIARDAGLDAEGVAIEASGPVWQTIVEVTDRHDAAAIVMGSRGLSTLQSMLLGSVSAGVVRHTKRPTLVIRGPSEDEGEQRNRQRPEAW